MKLYVGYLKFIKINDYNNNRKAKCLYLKYLGLPEKDTDSFLKSDNKLTDEVRRKIDLISGPHGKTIYKAWIAKYGIYNT